jgi:hypothetical protein
VLLAFGVSHVFFNRGEIGVSTPLVYPVLLYLLARVLLAGFRPRRGAGALVPHAPLTVLVVGLVFLTAFRVGLNAAGSRRSSTRLGSDASAAGVNRPVPTPARSASRNVAANPSTRTSPRNATARRTSANIAHPRRDQRSANAPNSGPKIIAGTTSASRTNPMAHGELNRSSATSNNATYAAPVPSADCANAAKKTRARRSCLRSSITDRIRCAQF